MRDDMPKQNRRALIVCNSKFEDDRFKALTAAPEDVERLADLLTMPHVGFDSDDITVLRNPSKLDFETAVLRFFKNAKRDDYLFFYYAGHGLRAQNGELYLALRKSTLEDFEANALEADFIKKQLSRCRAEAKVVVLDCCHARAFHRNEHITARDAPHDPGMLQGAFVPRGKGTYVLGASQSGSSAYEIKKDGRSYSLFTDAFIEGVKTGAAAPARETIRLGDIADYIDQQRNREGVETTPYFDVDNQMGALEFARHPTQNSGARAELHNAAAPTTAKGAPIAAQGTRAHLKPWLYSAAGIAILAACIWIGGTLLNNGLTNTPSSAPADGQFPLTLSHNEICAQNPTVNLDLSNFNYWTMITEGTNRIRAIQTPNGWADDGQWYSIADDAVYGKKLSVVNVIEVCPCSEARSVAEITKFRAKDRATIMFSEARRDVNTNGDTVSGSYLQGQPAISARLETSRQSSSNGTKELRIAFWNDTENSALGYMLEGTLSSPQSYFGKCRR